MLDVWKKEKNSIPNVGLMVFYDGTIRLKKHLEQIQVCVFLMGHPPIDMVD